MTTDAGVAPYMTALIAVGGTLLGALIAGTFGLLQGRRVARWQRRDAWLRFYDERSRTVWNERRSAYGRMVKAMTEFRDAVAVAGDSDLPRTHHELMAEMESRDEAITPYRNAFKVSLGEIVIVGESAVADAALAINENFKKASMAIFRGKLDDADVRELDEEAANLIKMMRQGAFKMPAVMQYALSQDSMLRFVDDGGIRKSRRVFRRDKTDAEHTG